MTMNEIRDIARNMGIVPAKKKKAELIRAIQQAEGNLPCFETGQRDTCGQDHCLWRPDCS